MADLRDLHNPLFVKVCLKLSEDTHGIQWAKKVFALAGFRDSLFYKMIEVERIHLSSEFTENGKLSLIETVKRIASETTVDKGPYKWHHPIHGTGTVKHGRNTEVGKCFALDVKTPKAFYVVEGGGYAMVDPMNSGLLIIETADSNSGSLRLSRLVGYWSNWHPHPNPKMKEMF